MKSNVNTFFGFQTARISNVFSLPFKYSERVFLHLSFEYNIKQIASHTKVFTKLFNFFRKWHVWSYSLFYQKERTKLVTQFFLATEIDILI